LKIAFLHTADVHVQTFDQLINNLMDKKTDVQLIHEVHPTWLAEVSRVGITSKLRQDVTALLLHLASNADAVVCTCSSLGPIAQSLGRDNIFRIDEPMMKKAVINAPVMLAVCLESTRIPSETLLLQMFEQQNLQPKFITQLCSDAWVMFESGDMPLFAQAIAQQLEHALTTHPDIGCIVLAQASMAAAEPLLQHLNVPVFTSPQLAAERALTIAQRNQP